MLIPGTLLQEARTRPHGAGVGSKEKQLRNSELHSADSADRSGFRRAASGSWNGNIYVLARRSQFRHIGCKSSADIWPKTRLRSRSSPLDRWFRDQRTH